MKQMTPTHCIYRALGAQRMRHPEAANSHLQTIPPPHLQARRWYRGVSKGAIPHRNRKLNLFL